MTPSEKGYAWRRDRSISFSVSFEGTIARDDLRQQARAWLAFNEGGDRDAIFRRVAQVPRLQHPKLDQVLQLILLNPIQMQSHPHLAQKYAVTMLMFYNSACFRDSYELVTGATVCQWKDVCTRRCCWPLWRYPGHRQNWRGGILTRALVPCWWIL